MCFPNWSRVSRYPLNFNLTINISDKLALRSRDDPKIHKGLAHYLEHIVVGHYNQKHDSQFDCETFPLKTVFSWVASIPTITSEFETWTKYLFVQRAFVSKPYELNTEEILEQEKERVDNEFYERWNNKQMQINEMLCLRGSGMLQFRTGNRGTLAGDTMTDEIDKLRQHYRRRPVSACVYTKKDLGNVRKRINCL